MHAAAVRPAGRYGALSIDERGHIHTFREKPQVEEAYSSGGFMVCGYRVFDYLEDDPAIMFECQIAAFRADNFPGAYRCVASAVQQRFTIAQFKFMIRRDYGTITQPRGVEFGFVEVRGGDAFVQVFPFDEDGMNHPFLYTLIAEDARSRHVSASFFPSPNRSVINKRAVHD